MGPSCAEQINCEIEMKIRSERLGMIRFECIYCVTADGKLDEGRISPVTFESIKQWFLDVMLRSMLRNCSWKCFLHQL